jgi:hypothetical protein
VLAFVGNLGDLPHAGAFEYLNQVGVPDLLVSAGAHKYGSDPQGHPWTVQGLMDAIESMQGWKSDLLVEDIDITISDTDHTAIDAGRMLRVVVDDNGKGRFEYFGPVYLFR